MMGPLLRSRNTTLAALLAAVLIPACTGTKPIVCPPPGASPGASLVDFGKEVTSIAGGTNSLWALRRVGRRGSQSDLVQVDPSTGRIKGTPIPLPDFGWAVAVGLDGVWVTTGPGFNKLGKATGPGSLFQVDASSHRIRARVRVGRWPDAVAVGDGAVWVANFQDNTVSRVDPTRHTVVATISIPDGPDRIFAFGGKVWVQTNNESAPLFRIDPADNRSTLIPNAPMQNVGLGAVWVIGPWASKAALRRLDQATGRPFGPGLPLDIQPASVAIAGPDLWVAKFFFFCGKRAPTGPPAVSLAWFRVDPRTLRSLSGPVFVGGYHHVGIPVFSEGSLWFLANSGSQVVKIDLAKARRTPPSPTIRLPLPLLPSA